MRDIVSALRANRVAWLSLEWIGPTLLFAGVWRVFVLPDVHLAFPLADTAELPLLSEALVILLGGVTLGIGLYTASNTLTRILEGYYIWPPRLEKWLTSRQVKRWEELWRSFEGHEAPDAERLEVLNLFPRQEDFILPFKLGNVLRAGETYGWVQYGISTVDLWVHLLSSAEGVVREAVSDARVQLDFFVASVWLSIASSLLSLWLTVEMSWWFLLSMAIFSILAYILYRLATVAAANYTRALWALVDMSRESLATHLGLRLPDNLEDEMQVWKAVTNFAVWGRGWTISDKAMAVIDRQLGPRGEGYNK